MKYNPVKGGEIEGHLDIYISQQESRDEEGKPIEWQDVLIHGDPEGLRSFAKLLLKIADLDQENVPDKYLPMGAKEHYRLSPNMELSNSSVPTIVGRLDAKGTGAFYERYIPKVEGEW